MSNKNKEEVVPSIPIRVADIGGGLAIWKVPLTSLREQDKNARVMEVEMFNRLADNIKKNGNLEALPLTMLITDKETNEPTFSIISGHHRTRAARAAGLTEIYVLVYEIKLSISEIRAKQIAHNQISGYDDKQVLKQIYLEIETIDAKLESGLSDFDLKIDTRAPQINDITISLDYELLNILFLPRQTAKLEAIFDQLEPEAKKYIADKKDFEKIAAQMRTISKIDNIRNVSAIVARMIEIVDEYFKSIKSNDQVKSIDEKKAKAQEKSRAKK